MTSKVLFKYIEGTDEIEYGDLTVRTGTDTVQISATTAEILHNNIPIGGNGGSPSEPFLFNADVVKCNIRVPGHPEEYAQTIRVPLTPFILDAGNYGNSAPGLRLLTIDVVSSTDVDLVIPNFSFTHKDIQPNEFELGNTDMETFINGVSLGRKEVDSVTGKNLWRVIIDMRSVYSKYPYESLLIGVTFDVCPTTLDSL